MGNAPRLLHHVALCVLHHAALCVLQLPVLFTPPAWPQRMLLAPALGNAALSAPTQDVPAVLEYVLQETGAEQLHWVGHR